MQHRMSPAFLQPVKGHCALRCDVRLIGVSGLLAED